MHLNNYLAIGFGRIPSLPFSGNVACNISKSHNDYSWQKNALIDMALSIYMIKNDQIKPKNKSIKNFRRDEIQIPFKISYLEATFRESRQ